MAEAAVTTRLKKLINTPETEVKDALAGMAAAHGDLIRVEYDPNVIIRKDAPRKGKVGLVSGGGSGHEPMHGGYVGMGMLDAACPGAVFTSPTPDQMARATAAVDGGAGVLHVVKNYTGDIMNFEMAAELARGEGAKVNAVITNDDVAVQDSLYTAGRRGVGVTVLLEKIVGGCAEAGADLDGDHAGEESQFERPQHGDGAHLVHRASGRQGDVRDRRRRDGAGHRHPRRAR